MYGVVSHVSRKVVYKTADLDDAIREAEMLQDETGYFWSVFTITD